MTTVNLHHVIGRFNDDIKANTVFQSIVLVGQDQPLDESTVMVGNIYDICGK